MISLYMHSPTGDSKHCTSSKELFCEFGQQLADYFFIFEDGGSLVQSSYLMLKWSTEYLYTRVCVSNAQDLKFSSVFHIFIFQFFDSLHKDMNFPNIGQVSETLLDLVRGGNQVKYEEFIVKMNRDC